MPNTLPLDVDTWDIGLNASGDLYVIDEDHSAAQDVASSIMTFLGECRYDTTLGMPYFESIFGQRPPASLVTAKIKNQAFTIDGIETCKTVGLQLLDRQLTGTVVVTRTGGTNPIIASF
jgi:hypothetical protein